MNQDTTAAISTPPGRGGIGVVRISGPRALEIAAKLIRLPKFPPETQHATRGNFLDPESGRTLDQVVLTFFRRPHSYTGEDVVEISCHGAPVVLEYLLECSMRLGARLAEPGEFTMRAFLNGRIDLTQAEAIRDLIDSRTRYQARLAAQQMEGSVSARLRPYKEKLVGLIAQLEAGIDFAEDDIPVSDWDEIISRIGSLQEQLGGMLRSSEHGRLVREGMSLAIVGRPNVGKSSLFNRLLNEDRAIVTGTPGTTRDLVSEAASIGGIPVRLVDTAGIRHATDEVEKIGVEKSLQALADSDLRMLVVDASEGWTEKDESLLAKMRPLGRLVVAINKCDLVSAALIAPKANSATPSPGPAERGHPFALLRAGSLPQGDEGNPDFPQKSEGNAHFGKALLGTINGQNYDIDSISPLAPAGRNNDDLNGTSPLAPFGGEGPGVRGSSLDPPFAIVRTSALTGEGLPQLHETILSLAAPARGLESEDEVITNMRHQNCIRQALDSLLRAREAAASHIPHEMLLLDLYDALHALDAVTGATTTDDLLEVIFSSFCVGK